MTWIDLGILIVKCIVLSLAATAIFAYFTLLSGEPSRACKIVSDQTAPDRVAPCNRSPTQ